MSKIFQALERAEREGTLRNQRSSGSQAKRSPDDTRQPSFVSPVSLPPKPPLSTNPELERKPEKKNIEGADPHLISILVPATLEAEQYRAICYNIEKIQQEQGSSILGITSSAVGDGKTTTAINLAATFAQSPGKSVLLMDLDLRRPAVMRRLGLPQHKGPGFVEIIVHPHFSLTDAVQHYDGLKFSLLSPGESSLCPHDVLNSPRVGTIFQEARQQYDYVLVDLPPLLPAFDSQSLERWVDGFVLVVSADKTPRKCIAEALRVVEQAKLMGLILNNYHNPLLGYYLDYSRDDTHHANGIPKG